MTAIFPILWPILTISLSAFLLVVEILWVRTSEVVWYRHARFWTKLLVLKLVNSLQDLQNVSLDLAGIYALGRNIDASATSRSLASVVYTPIGNSATPFSGQFDGMGHSVDRLGQTGGPHFEPRRGP